MSEFGKLSRRGFLGGTSLAAAGLTMGFTGLFGLTSAAAAGSDDSVQDIINVAATAEAFAVTHYYRALQSTTKAKFDAAQIAYLKAGLESEQAHFDFLIGAGAKPVATSFYFPAGTFDSVKTFGTVTSIAETVFVAAYCAAARRFAELNQPLLSATAAQVAVVEGQHLALVNQMAGIFPNNIALAAPVFYKVSDAVGIVMPLLNGKKGGLGDMETATVAQPSAADVKTAVGKSQLIGTLGAPFNTLPAPYNATIEPFTTFGASMTASATMAPTGAATMAATKSS